MSLDELKQSWKSKFKENIEIQTRIWDDKADEFDKKEQPSFQNNDFLALLEKKVELSDQLEVLDIGCGAGQFSNAIANKVKSVIGVDLSSKMVEYACTKAEKQGVDNVQFKCINWADVDIKELKWEKKFDVVFAHLTPAICDFATFEKMNSCAKKFCIFSKPTRRDDVVLDKAFELIGIKKDILKEDRDFLNAFNYLWHKGHSAFVKHEDTVWKPLRTVEQTVSWCIDRAKLRKELSLEEESKIYEYIKSLAVDGMVEEVITTKIATIYWEV